MLSDLPDQRRRLLRFSRRHACRRLVEEQELRVGGERQADLEISLLAVRQVACQLVTPLLETEGSQERSDGAFDVWTLPERAEVARDSCARLRGNANVVVDGDAGEDVGDLECLGQAAPVDGLRRKARDVIAEEPHT